MAKALFEASGSELDLLKVHISMKSVKVKIEKAVLLTSNKLEEEFFLFFSNIGAVDAAILLISFFITVTTFHVSN